MYKCVPCVGGWPTIIVAMMFVKWGAQWPSGLERWLGLAPGRFRPGSNPTAKNFSLRNFGNSVCLALPVSYGGDTKTVGIFYLVSMPGEVKDPTSPALECVTVVDSTTHSKLLQKCVYVAENAALRRNLNIFKIPYLAHCCVSLSYY